ncbi:hypothetical protein BRADI_4g12177v3 [Brachypodium distachyon]|uniref:Uncharacterized protein n=1 Tax=Brachypodium distachyon TaxID=15368 RepID=A0A2K2CM93_BRADI|nr:hypothetical protein BRADI_4g12177v3 [Brachypodium distachyon]
MVAAARISSRSSGVRCVSPSMNSWSMRRGRGAASSNWQAGLPRPPRSAAPSSSAQGGTGSWPPPPSTSRTPPPRPPGPAPPHQPCPTLSPWAARSRRSDSPPHPTSPDSPPSFLPLLLVALDLNPRSRLVVAAAAQAFRGQLSPGPGAYIWAKR